MNTNDNLNFGFMLLNNGKRFSLSELNIDILYIEDYAKSLSKINRFVGHTKFPLSVAQHSVLMSEHCDKGLELACLMHDAHEVFIGDLAKPIKDFIGNDFKVLEGVIQDKVLSHFGIIIPKEVYELDLRMAYTESLQLIGSVDGWPKIEPINIKIHKWTAEYAEDRFLTRYYELINNG